MRLKKYFPTLYFHVVPHEAAHFRKPTARSADTTRSLRILVIGAINSIKGFDVLCAVASDARRQRLPFEFKLLGYSVNDAKLRKAGVEVLGKYDDSEAVEKIDNACADLVWLPSIWPETYCYTLTHAMHAGLPVACFDLGAIAERLRDMQWPRVIMPLVLSKEPTKINDIFEAIRLGSYLWAH